MMLSLMQERSCSDVPPPPGKFRICVDHLPIPGLVSIEMNLQMIRIPNVITIKKSNILPLRHLHSDIASVPRSPVLTQMEEADPAGLIHNLTRIVFRKALNLIPILGPVIDDIKFPVRITLQSHTLYSCPQGVNTVIDRHDHREHLAQSLLLLREQEAITDSAQVVVIK